MMKWSQVLSPGQPLSFGRSAAAGAAAMAIKAAAANPVSNFLFLLVMGRLPVRVDSREAKAGSARPKMTDKPRFVPKMAAWHETQWIWHILPGSTGLESSRTSEGSGS